MSRRRQCGSTPVNPVSQRPESFSTGHLQTRAGLEQSCRKPITLLLANVRVGMLAQLYSDAYQYRDIVGWVLFRERNNTHNTVHIDVQS